MQQAEQPAPSQDDDKVSYITTCHEVMWYVDDKEMRWPLNVVVLLQWSWEIQNSGGKWLEYMSNIPHCLSYLDNFLSVFPLFQLDLIHRLTNDKHIKLDQPQELTKSELLQFFVVLLLISKFISLASNCIIKVYSWSCIWEVRNVMQEI